MCFAASILSVVAIRRQPDLHSEMVSQLLFGECYEILEERGPFQRIRVVHDGYGGWIDGRQGARIDREEYEARQRSAGETPLLLDLTAMATYGSEVRVLVRGSSLPATIAGKELHCSGASCRPSSQELSPDRVVSLVADYLHAPYCWGGRSPLGIDCSGLVQTVYRFFGLGLERDSKDQSRQGREISSLGQATPGDLAFFDSVSDGSSHVGIVVSDGIIHASGKVRHDLLTEEGIHRRESGSLTHRLTALRSHS